MLSIIIRSLETVSKIFAKMLEKFYICGKIKYIETITKVNKYTDEKHDVLK